jgi:regulator of cell morphogenesis and NO signaling
MTITTSTLVADIATANPATIKVFQRHRIDFCCGGRIPLGEVCEAHQIQAPALIGELGAERAGAGRRLTTASLASLASYIRRGSTVRSRRSRGLRDGGRSCRAGAPAAPGAAQATFADLQNELLDHVKKEDVALPGHRRARSRSRAGPFAGWTLIDQPIGDGSGACFRGGGPERIAERTDGHVPPADACPTFRGLYHGLAEPSARCTSTSTRTTSCSRGRRRWRVRPRGGARQG